MTRFSTLASVAVVTLLVGTSAALAFGPIGGLSDSLNSGGSDGPGSPYNPQVSDSVVTTTDEILGDAVLDGQNTIPINTVVLGGKKAGHGAVLVLALTCKVGGNDLVTLRNAGSRVPAGTKVRWDVASLGEHGVVRLPADLDTGAAVRIDAAAGLAAGAPCAARAI